MDRRQFILACQKAAAATSLLPIASLALTAPAAPIDSGGTGDPIEHIDNPAPVSSNSRLGLLAVGGMGTACLREVAGNLSGVQRLIAIDTDPDALQSVQADRRIHINCGIMFTELHDSW